MLLFLLKQSRVNITQHNPGFLECLKSFEKRVGRTVAHTEVEISILRFGFSHTVCRVKNEANDCGVIRIMHLHILQGTNRPTIVAGAQITLFGVCSKSSYGQSNVTLASPQDLFLSRSNFEIYVRRDKMHQFSALKSGGTRFRG